MAESPKSNEATNEEVTSPKRNVSANVRDRILAEVQRVRSQELAYVELLNNYAREHREADLAGQQLVRDYRKLQEQLVKPPRIAALEHEHPSLRPYSRGTYGSLLGAESPERRVLEKQILELRQKLTGVEAALAKSGETARAKDQQLKEKDRVIQEITRSEDLKHFIDHVHPDARPLLIAGGELLENFIRSSHCQAWVLSLDIRRSTELMLKARSPSDFATFIASLAESIKAIILRNFGVFDKFTGDGVLAFFPDFYSGEDAGYLAVRTASECHELFNSLYRAHRSLFSIIPLETGLGIGIDRGEVSLVKIGVNLTVVGTPVVYACRLSSTKAGTTALNHGAYESLLNRYGAQLSFDETALDIKHEGSVLNTRARFALGEFCQ